MGFFKVNTSQAWTQTTSPLTKIWKRYNHSCIDYWKLNICYDQGYNDILVVTETK